MSTLTTANSTLLLSVASLFPTPVPIQGYATDDAFMTEQTESAETYMGVDGVLSAGYTPYAVPFEISLQADSVSNDFFDAWINAERTAREKYIANGTLLIQGTGMLYTFTRGFLQKFNPIPDGKKVLQPRKFSIHWNQISQAPV